MMIIIYSGIAIRRRGRLPPRTCPVRTRLRTFPSRFPLLRLDRIYVTRDGMIRSAWTDRKAGACSDHLPVIADVAFAD